MRLFADSVAVWLIALTIMGCSSGLSQQAALPLATPTKVRSVRTIAGGLCDLRYQNFIRDTIDHLRASGLFDSAHECNCLAAPINYIKKQMTRPEESGWKHIEVDLEAPFAIPSNLLPKELEPGRVVSVLISGNPDPRGIGTIIYLGIPDRSNRVEYLAFRYRDDLFNLNHNPNWLKPNTWNAPSAHRECKEV